MDSKNFRPSANRRIISMITDTANRFGKQKIWLLLIGAIVGFNLGVNAGTEESASLQELLREYRTAATDAAGHRGRLLGKLKYLFEQAPLWWRYQIDVAADVADAADTPLLWPKDYRTLYESASRKPYRVSVDCEVPEGGELVIEVPLHPNGRSKLSLVVEDRVKWSTELQTRSRENQPGSELFFLSGPWWHTAELRVEEKGVAVFLGCDDTIVAFLVDIADGDILQELRFGLHEPLAR